MTLDMSKNTAVADVPNENMHLGWWRNGGEFFHNRLQEPTIFALMVRPSEEEIKNDPAKWGH